MLSATTTAAAAAAAQKVFAKLTDPGVQTLAQADYAATQSITRNDLLSIFIEVENDHVVSAAELSSLQTLVANASTVGMPGYVADLAGKCVNGDPANVYLKSAASANGDVYAGCVASQLKVLVNDWFEGGGPIATTNSSVKLSWASGTLFAKGGVPHDSDIAQGVIGDCTLLASLAEVALRQPQTIENMFINNGDGSVTVRLYHNGVPNYVTVDAQLPDGGTLYDRPVNGVLWAALVEKAIVEENAEGWLGTWYPGSDSYAALNGGDQGTAVAYLSTLTGLSSSYFGVDPSNIVADWQANKLVVLSTGTVPAGSGLVADHCYAMVGYNAASSTPIALFNPWGAQAPPPNISAATLTSSFQFGAAAGSGLPSNSQTTLIANEFSSIAPTAVVASPEFHAGRSALTATANSSSASENVSGQTHHDTDAFFADWFSGVGGQV
jgi:Calpain family cysteine protease